MSLCSGGGGSALLFAFCSGTVCDSEVLPLIVQSYGNVPDEAVSGGSLNSVAQKIAFSSYDHVFQFLVLLILIWQ